MKKNKYNAKKRTIDGHTFDSSKECMRYLRLKADLQDKKIANLRLQPKFTLQEGFTHEGKSIRALTYVADFSYHKDGQFIVEDTKGYRTEVYKIKRKLFLFKYPEIKFIET